ncbi:MAG: DUF4197 domain-containing protein [Saprospiraceae bacterium]|nr:DUF4197 domain-containing protein [Saprospiraceae bacterium]
MKKFNLVLIAIIFTLSSCDVLESIIGMAPQGPAPLTNSEIVAGLKDALNVGTKNAVGNLSQEGGFLNNPVLKIPFPPEAQKVEEKLRQIGMGNKVDEFVVNMNKGASEAVKQATPIFANAVKSMSFADAKQILQGPDNAATNYFKDKTSAELFKLFQPKVQQTLDQVAVTKYWDDITGIYNKIPFVTKVETDLTKYVTEKAMDGLFFKIAEEEKKIRTDPVARVTDILKKVFAK